MRLRSQDSFPTIRTEGGLLPPDLIQRIAAGDKDIDGLTPADYHLAEGERVNEAVARAWNRLVGAWTGFRTILEKTPNGDPATTPTREKWMLVLFQELGYGRLATARAVALEGDSYPVSHGWGSVPIHLVGARVDLDSKAKGVAGAARSSPHGLVQAFLNRSDRHDWGFVSNGLKLRILRDSANLTRQAFVEFDLEAMMEGQVHADFVVLWLLCHESRVEGEKPSEFWLERWSRSAERQGTRALDALRDGVQTAIESLGQGFLAHPSNGALRERLRSGGLPAQDFYRQLLRLAYRLLFLFVAEDRGLVHAPDASPTARMRYDRFYSTRRLRLMAGNVRGAKHPDLYRALRLVSESFNDDAGCPTLGLYCLGGFLWSRQAVIDLGGAELANRDFLTAIRALAFTRQGKLLRAVDYKNLGSEELGSIYESLLELHPRLSLEAATFSLDVASGHERKTTGSYYTPTSLIQCLLDSALDPVLDEAARQKGAEQAILALKLCDPACGSGHFLIAAAHRIARRLAAVRSGDDEPSPDSMKTALRDVIGHCIYGVDQNPMAVELCKVSLWLEALEPGKPLSFLEHRILLGNSLLGATPALIDAGIPDATFRAIEGDDPEMVKVLKRRNREERTGQRTFRAEMAAEPQPIYETLSESVSRLSAGDDTTIAAIREKEARLNRLVASREYRQARLAADAWCAAFVWRKTNDGPSAITEDVFRRLRRDPSGVSPVILKETARIADAYRFLHWHIAFPDVFRVPDGEDPANELTGWSGGFDVLLGNPPWERIKLQEKEWFAERHPLIAQAPNAAVRKRLIAALENEAPELLSAFAMAQRVADGESHLVRDTGRYPLCGRGDINTYTIFTELKRSLIGPRGRVGTIVPSGIATDDTTKWFFQDLVPSGSLVSLYSFFEVRRMFIATDSRSPFCLLTIAGRASDHNGPAEFAFDLRAVDDLVELDRRFTLDASDIALLNPNTHTCPIFRTRRDAEITKAIYRRMPVLLREGSPEENPWDVSFMAMFHMANDSGRFQSRDQLERHGWTLEGNVFRLGDTRNLPLYEAKMVHHFDHRFGDYRDHPARSESTTLPRVPVSRLADPTYSPLARYWVAERDVTERLEGRWDRGWLLGWRDICRSTDERTVIASVIPLAAAGDKFLLMFSARAALETAVLVAALSSLPFDYVARQKVGGSGLKYFAMRQLPVIPPDTTSAQVPWGRSCTVADWIARRALELTFSAWDMQCFARDLAYHGAPFRWDPDRRFLIRCELDAAFFHLYGLVRADVDYVLSTFPIIQKRDQVLYGEYRTKRVVLERYDSLQHSVTTGNQYLTPLNPPPGDSRAAHEIVRPDQESGRTEGASRP